MQVIIFNSEVFHKDLMKNLKIFYRIYFAGVFLLITYSSVFAEEKKIPLNASERKLLEQSRIEIPSHYIEAHDFEGEMASGKKASLADFSGKFLILNFWATWCSPCLKEMPDLDQVYQSLGPDKLVVLAVSMGESRERVRKFLKKRNYSFPVMTDPEMEITRLYGVRNIPITYLVDPSGVIIGRALGPREWSDPKLLKFFRSRMKRQAG